MRCWLAAPCPLSADLVAMIEDHRFGPPPMPPLFGAIDPEGHVCARSNGHRSEEDLQALG